MFTRVRYDKRSTMRAITVSALALVLTAVAAADVAAQVQSTTSRDGSKAIYNIPGPSRSNGGRGPDYVWLAKQRNRSSEFDEIINRHARRYGVDPVLVRAVITVESNFNPSLVSSKGARGLMQLMPATGKRFGVEAHELHDPEENIRGGVAYLAQLQRLFPGDLRRVLAAYNAGEGAVQRYRGIPPYSETQTYVLKALSVYHGRAMGSGAPLRGGEFRSRGRLAGGFKATSSPGVRVIAANTVAISSSVNPGGAGRRR